MELDPANNRSRTRPGQLVLRVGPDQGDLQGRDDRVLQAGVDYLHRLGGGVLHILPGEYTMHNALYLHPNLTIRGEGQETVLKKAPSAATPLIRDTDWYENRVAVEDPAEFAPGRAILLRSWVKGTLQVVRDTVVERDGHDLVLSSRLEKNFWLEEEAAAATLFPLLTAEWVDDVRVQDLVLDGNMEHNDEIDGNYAGGVFIQHCDRHTFCNVTARNYHGDGFSFQVCDDVRFEYCRAENNANLGFHPGSGSQRPVFHRCTARGNGQGIFFCWGVTRGLAAECTCAGNTDFGISIGHRDTDNRITGCHIEGNAKVGILFRAPNSEFRGGHRNLIEGCDIRDNGHKAEGVGLDVRGPTHDVEIRDNRFEDSGNGRQRIGIRIGPEARNIKTSNNRFEGLADDVVRSRPHPGDRADPEGR